MPPTLRFIWCLRYLDAWGAQQVPVVGGHGLVKGFKIWILSGLTTSTEHQIGREQTSTQGLCNQSRASRMSINRILASPHRSRYPTIAELGPKSHNKCGR